MKRINFVTPLIIIYLHQHHPGMGLQHQNVIGSMNNITDGVDGGNVEEVKRELNQGDVV
jgi:hypothetical protein